MTGCLHFYFLSLSMLIFNFLNKCPPLKQLLRVLPTNSSICVSSALVSMDFFALLWLICTLCVLVFQGCHNKLFWTSKLNTTKIPSLTVLETRCSRSKCFQGHAPLNSSGKNSSLPLSASSGSRHFLAYSCKSESESLSCVWLLWPHGL